MVTRYVARWVAVVWWLSMLLFVGWAWEPTRWATVAVVVAVPVVCVAVAWWDSREVSR